MDLSRRKRSSDDSANGNGDRRKRRRSVGDGKVAEVGERDHRSRAAAVNDADVEEFYAILQRVRTTRCVVAGGGGAVSNGVRRTGAEQIRWRPRFVKEDFEGCSDAVKDNGGGGAGSGEAVSGEDKAGEVRARGGLELDLNADPDPEPEGGDCTARSCARVEA